MKVTGLTILLFILLLPLTYSDVRQVSKMLDFGSERTSSIDNLSLFTSTSSLPVNEEDVCVIEGDRRIKVNESFIPDPPKCYNITCRRPNEPVYEGCTSIKVSENCYGSFYDMTAKYPKCCPKEVCP